MACCMAFPVPAASTQGLAPFPCWCPTHLDRLPLPVKQELDGHKLIYLLLVLLLHLRQGRRLPEAQRLRPLPPVQTLQVWLLPQDIKHGAVLDPGIVLAVGLKQLPQPRKLGGGEQALRGLGQERVLDSCHGFEIHVASWHCWGGICCIQEPLCDEGVYADEQGVAAVCVQAGVRGVVLGVWRHQRQHLPHLHPC